MIQKKKKKTSQETRNRWELTQPEKWHLQKNQISKANILLNA